MRISRQHTQIVSVMCWSESMPMTAEISNDWNKYMPGIPRSMEYLWKRSSVVREITAHSRLVIRQSISIRNGLFSTLFASTLNTTLHIALRTFIFKEIERRNVDGNHSFYLKLTASYQWMSGDDRLRWPYCDSSPCWYITSTAQPSTLSQFQKSIRKTSSLFLSLKYRLLVTISCDKSTWTVLFLE